MKPSKICSIEKIQPERLYRDSEVAPFLGVSHWTLKTWRRRGEGPPHVTVGSRSVRYRGEKLLAWLDNLSTGPGNGAAA